MATINTTDNGALLRSQTWNDELEVRFDDENFMITGFAEWLTDYEGTDTTITIPGVGETQMVDYVEGQEVQQFGLEDSFFTFKPDQEKAGAVTITRKMLRNSYYANQVLPFIAQDQARQCYKIVEEFIFELSKTLPYAVDGVQHRLTGSGAGGDLALADFSKAKAAIHKSANLTSNYIAFVSPAMASQIEQSIGITQQANSQFEPIAAEGLLNITGTAFKFNIYGVDIYSTNFLADGVDSTGSGGVDNTGKKAVLVFSAAEARKLPFIAAWIDKPSFEVDEDKLKRVEHHICYMAFGAKLHHAVNLVVIECNEPGIV